jgi:preprotein translocase subunit YajC
MNIFNQAMAAEAVEVVEEVANPTMAQNIMGMLPMVAIFAIFYFFLLRPQMKKQREVQSMISNLKKGDRVVAAGGVVGKIIKIEEDIVSLEIDTNSKMQVVKSSIAENLSTKIEESNNKKK